MSMTIRYDAFLGLDKTNEPIKHRADATKVKLVKAENVNISRNFSVERRDGYSLWQSGSYSSLWGNGTDCYAVKSGNLIQIEADKTETVLVESVGNFPMRFADAKNGDVYFTNGLRIGKIRNGVAYDLGTSSDEFKLALPAGDLISFMAPRVLVARKNVLYLSDPVNRDVYHRHLGFIQFETDIRMIAPIGRSLFISDSKATWFLSRMEGIEGVNRPLYKMEKRAGYPAVPGNAVEFMEEIRNGDKEYAECAMWVSDRGICIGAESGVFENLTERRYEMPDARLYACVANRRINDLNLFISVIKGA